MLSEEFDVHLNLNFPGLCESRKAVLDGVRHGLERRLGSGSWSRAKLESTLAVYRADVPLAEYFGVIEYWLEKKIRRK
jgi:hypothetical protein